MATYALFADASRGSENLSIFDPVSPSGESIRSLSVLVFFITGLIFVVVSAVLYYCVFRFRRSNAPPAGTEPVTQEPPQLYGSKPIEIAWTAAPTLVVFVLVLVTSRTLWDVTPSPREPKADDHTLHVTVVGRQWWWEYRYDHFNGRALGFVTANELHVPAGEGRQKRPVFLRLQSADVCHSFWVPRLGGKMDLIPGKTNSLGWQTQTPGLYLGQCAEFCGTQHAGMLLRVYVDTPEEFERWLGNEAKPAVADAAVKAGRDLFLAQSCGNCHAIRGTAAKGTYAPDLTHLMSRKTFASGLFEVNEDNLRKWIGDPQKMKPGCLMPGFRLGKQDMKQVVDYLQTLR